jgi:hypothetical protein
MCCGGDWPASGLPLTASLRPLSGNRGGPVLPQIRWVSEPIHQEVGRSYSALEMAHAEVQPDPALGCEGQRSPPRGLKGPLLAGSHRHRRGPG